MILLFVCFCRFCFVGLFKNKTMDSKELRIGNFVFCDNEKHHKHLKNIPLKIESIHEAESLKRGIWTHSVGLGHLVKLEGLENHEFEELYESNRNYNQFIFFIKPIPLTEEWLLKFGFEKVSKDIDGYYIWIIDHITIFGQNKGYDYNDLTNIQYVHQLQNLYFALTQKELIIK